MVNVKDLKMITLKEQLDKYSKELEEDIKLDRINISDVQLKLPGIKGKWVSRLMNHKSNLVELITLREETIVQLATKIKNESPVTVTDVFLHKEAERHELIKKVDKEITNQRNLIEYLEKIEKIVSSTTYDIKNLCELMKSETM